MVARSMSPTTGRESHGTGTGTDTEPPYSPTASASSAAAITPPGANSINISSVALSPGPTPTKSPTRTAPPLASTTTAAGGGTVMSSPTPSAPIPGTAAALPCQASSPLSELTVGLNNQDPVSTVTAAVLAPFSCAGLPGNGSSAASPAVVAAVESVGAEGVRDGAASAAATAVGASGPGFETGGGDGDGDGDGDGRSGGDDGAAVVDTPSVPSSGQGEEEAASAAATPPPTPTRGRKNVVSLQLGKDELLPPTEPPIVPPSACTTPAGSPRANPAGGNADAMMSPPASPWPANGSSANGNVNGGSMNGGGRAAATAAGSRARGDVGDRAWKKAYEGNGYRGAGGDAFCMSPISAKAFSPRVSPRAMMSSPSPPKQQQQQQQQQRGTSIFAGGGRLEGSEWWKGLDLSPDRSGLPRWRESRSKPASSLPSSSTNPSDNDNDHDHDNGASGVARSGRATPDMNTNTTRVEAGGGMFSPFSSPVTATRMSRSYVTLLAAAAATAEGTDGRSQVRTPGAGRGGPADGAAVEQDRPLTAEDRLRQLEAENLRLRFRVADLEGQVSVMEDELDRRGVPRPMASDPLPTATGSAGNVGNVSNVSRVITTTMGGGAITVTTPQPKGVGVGGGGGGEEAEAGGDGPLLSPRGRGYLARLVLEVCAELEESKSKKAATRAGTASAVSQTVDGLGTIPQSERLCKVLPKVMETAIKGVRDLDEQVFEQMMRQASERPAMPASVSLFSPSSTSAAGVVSPPSNGYGFMMPLGTPARRLSSCVVARDGGAEFFAQSPAPGRPASFFRVVGEPKTPRAGGGSVLRRSSSNVKGAGRDSLGRGENGVSEVVRAASAWDTTPSKVGFSGARHPERERAPAEQRDSAAPGKGKGKSKGKGKGQDVVKGKKTPRSGGAGGFFGAGDWLAAAFTPRGALAPDPPDSPRAPAPDTGGEAGEERGAADGGGGGEARGEADSFTPLAVPPPPPRAAASAAESVTASDKLSFEGSTEEVLRYTIVAKSYLIRSKSKRHGEGRDPSPVKTLLSPGGTARKVEEGGEEDVRHLTKELLDLKTRYMAATQHWLKTDIVNDEELRMIRAQVFEAIQRKRSELHTEAAAVLRAERQAESPRVRNGSVVGTSNGTSIGCGDGADSGGWESADDKAAAAAREEEEANRTIAMLVGTAEFLKFSRLLLLLSEAISVSASASASASVSALASASGSKSSGVSASATAAAAAAGFVAAGSKAAGGTTGGGGGTGLSSSSSTSSMPPPPPQQQLNLLRPKL